jgi:adhesin/invasin
MTAHRLRRISLVAAAVAFAACKDDAPPTPAAIVPVSDVALTGTVGELIGAPLSVKVTDAGGSPVAGTVVTFAVADGGGSVSAQLDTTDFSGLASTQWRLGERVVAQRVTATATGVSSSVSFVATARPGAPATMSLSAGDAQSAAIGTSVATAPAVLVRDRYTNPVPGVTVLFSVTAGNGSVSNPGAITNANGVATVGSWTLGPQVGPNRLSAVGLFSGATGNPIIFSANGTAGAAASVVAVGSSSITGTVGALVTPIPSVRVLDAQGNPIAGASVVFTASTGSNVVNGTKTTDANGIAAPDGWQLGTTAQNYTLTATSGTLSTVITAAARPGAATQMQIVAGNNQSATVGRTLPIEPSVRVTDANNNPIPGIDVIFDVTAGGGTAVSRRQTTNALGVATVGGWTLGDDIGTNTLRASVTTTGVTVAPVNFTATAVAGTPVSMAAASGATQSATVGTAVTIAPSVIVRDGRGNPVAGITVTFSIGSGAGTITGATAVTGSTGVATVGSWTLGPAAGTQTLVARVTNLPDVVFTATAVPGAASVITAVSTPNLGSLVVANAQAAPSTPQVRVTDSQGNPIQGITVTFALGNANSGTITGETQTTNANGIATLTSWTLPTTAGIASVVATIPNVTGVTFTATMVPAAASRLALYNSTIPTNGAAASTVTVGVRLTDAFGNNVTTSGVVVTFTTSSTGAGTTGTVAPLTITTDASGIAATATWTLGSAATQTLTISAPGLTGLTYNVTVP